MPSEPVHRTLEIDGPVHVLEYPGEGPETLVLVHGLGGSALNWMRVAPALTRRGRVLAPDLAGHGETPLAGRSSSVPANRELLDRLLEATTDGPVVLMGNSMGGAISMLEADEAPDRVAALVLVDPALPIWPTEGDPVVLQTFLLYAMPGVGEEFVRMAREAAGPEAMVDYVQMCCVDVSRIPPEVREAHVEQLRSHGLSEEADAGFLESARTLLDLLQHPEQVREAAAGVRAPTLLLAGDGDRLVPPAAIHALADLRPDWELRMLPRVGHAPMLEDPDGFLGVVTPWLDGVAAAASARTG
jgi:pimeloyl-ACP methyl ester carboxylesterase